MRSLPMVLALCTCGDNALPLGEPLATAADLIVVAHQDDDLYFMQPDLLEAVQSARGITSVYVTAGDDTHGPAAADVRYEGLKYAYGAAAGSTDWRCGFISIHGHRAQHCRLANKPVSLVFLAYPDGGVDGEFASSLLKLWEGTITSAETVAHETTTYTQDELIETLTDVIRETHPMTIRTLEIASTHGRDHTDHMIVGALTLLASARAQSGADLISYRGYSVLPEPANKLPAILDATSNMVGYYEACSGNCAPCGESCASIDPAHIAWFARRYAVGFRRFAGGRLQTEGGCVTADLTIEACETAPAWTFDGRLHLGDRCLEAAGSGEVQLTICTDDLAQRFFVDDEGHVWSAVVPGPQPGMDYAHVSCLAPTATGIRTQLCGRDQGAPTWTFAPLEVSTPRTALLAASSEIRLGDIDGDGFGDLCALENAMLVCASGNGAGGFQTLATARFALAIEPLSLALGDVDRDGRIDACGRDADGIVCALAANNFVSTRWSTQLQTNSTLAVVGSYVCGINTDGVQCASQTDARTLSVWPPADSTVWPADFDGDGQPDWCDTSTASPACGVAAESAVTTDGSPWSFSVGGSLDASDDGVAVGDLDGDGRADLCSLDGAAIKCARSQGRGFGPRVTFAHLSSPATALWIGDLDGDGRADACVDSGLTIDCAIP